MFGPKNKVLGKEFLLSFIDCLKKSNVQQAKDSNDDIPNWSNFYDLHWTRDFYEPFIKQKNTITYNGEIYQIVSLALSNRKEHMVNTTYKDIWKECNTVSPSTLKAFETHHCSCMDENDDEDDYEEEVKKDRIEIYSINKFLKDYANKLSFNGTYCSQSGPYYPTAGAQYYWNLIFNYNEIIDGNSIDIRVKLGPTTRQIFKKYVASYGGTKQGLEPNIESRYKDVNDYIPDNLYFDSDFFPVIKNALLTKDKIFEYNGVKYKILDQKFCNVKSDMLGCGCCYDMCKPMTNTEGINRIPKQISYRDDITISCTPEWYLQVQIGCCNGGDYCARFILDLI